MMTSLTALMGRRLHRLIKLMRVDLQTKHRLHIFASPSDVVGAIVTQMLHVLEAMLHLGSEGVGEQADQCIGRPDLDRLLCHWNDWSNVEAGGLKARVGCAFSGPVQAHGGRDERLRPRPRSLIHGPRAAARVDLGVREGTSDRVVPETSPPLRCLARCPTWAPAVYGGKCEVDKRPSACHSKGARFAVAAPFAGNADDKEWS